MSRAQEYEPSPQEIRSQCKEIRKTWSEQERRKRAAAIPPVYRIPTVPTDPIPTTVSRDLYKELDGWDFLFDREVKAHERKALQRLAAKRILAEELAEIEQFETEVVEFGEVISQGM